MVEQLPVKEKTRVRYPLSPHCSLSIIEQCFWLRTRVVYRFESCREHIYGCSVIGNASDSKPEVRGS